ncbi:MAG: TetR family transcriptional regulator [Acidimicrobiales bacterium]
MTDLARAPSARQTELLEAAYAYALAHGLAALSLRPLAVAIGSSPRVLLYLFGSKDGLVRALLARARADELAMLDALRAEKADVDLADAAARVWDWLSDPAHRDLLRLWTEGYAHSLVDPAGPWGGFAEQTVAGWLAVLRQYQPAADRRSTAGTAQRSAVLAVLRGALLELLATGDVKRTTAAVHQLLATLA